MSGTTSAHAENTSSLSSALVGGRNYLRARGEYETAIIRIEPVQELPPRTRRIPVVCQVLVCGLGTTSAHAENTTFPGLAILAPWNYLRARGEYAKYSTPKWQYMELPPRTRRIPAQLLRAYRIRGTTSAHAENTTGSPSDTCGQGNYLRARGEYPRGD